MTTHTLQTREIVALKGLPGSGKTTLARQMQAESGYKRVNKDDTRNMVDDGVWSAANEVLIMALQRAMIDTMMAQGANIVVDDTNIEGKHIDRLQEVVDIFNGNDETYHYTLRVVELETSLDECLQRNSLREGRARVPDGAIYRMKSSLDKQKARAERTVE